ncbi:MAG TPA: hypothetical protein VIW19_11285 [Gaiellaceae bacterium]|jgi:hypothetical protein
MNWYRDLVGTFGLVAIAIGVALIVRTAIAGGGVGIVLGLLFIALGAGRLYMLRRRKH